MLLVNSNNILAIYAYGTNSHTIRVRYEIRVYSTQQSRKDVDLCLLTKLNFELLAMSHVYHIIVV